MVGWIAIGKVGNRVRGTRRSRIVLLLAMLVAWHAASAQSLENANRTVNLNYVYAAELGFGGYTIGGLTTNVFTFPYRTTIPLPGESGWAVQLSLPLELGIYDFKATDTDGRTIKLNQQSIALVPGAELHIPLGSHVMLKPFANLGVGHAFGATSASSNAWIYTVGVRAVTQFTTGPYTLSLGNAALYAGNSTVGGGFSESYTAIENGFEVRRPLGFHIANLEPDLGVYIADYYYPKPLLFSRFLNTALKVHNQVEFGFSIGSAAPYEFLWFSNARIGAGYVFGDGLQVWRINFGFPF
jgi:hypothetical protein